MTDQEHLPDVPREPLDSQETIEYAAIRHDGRVYAVGQPGGHNDVIHSMNAAGLDGGLALGGVFGFITSKGRFADRVEARKIALVAGQIRRVAGSAELFTGDLW